MKREEFLQQVGTHEASLSRYTTLSNRVGLIKLLLVLLLGVLVFFMFYGGIAGFSILAKALIVVLAVLVGFWVYHHKLHEKISYLNEIIAINKRHLARISGQWAEFLDIGAEFVDASHTYASDLDIVGPKSFFQFLNTTRTWYGRMAFANALLEPGFSDNELKLRQDAVTELGQDIEFSNDMEFSFSKIGASRAAGVLAADIGGLGDFIAIRVMKYVFMYMPLLTLVSIVLAVLQNSFVPLAIVMVCIQGLVGLLGIRNAHAYLKPISRMPYNLGAYSNVIEIIRGKSFESARLRHLQEKLGSAEDSAAKAIKELNSISSKADLRYNAILWFIANVLLLWDFWCAFLFERWVKKYSGAIEGWFLALGEFESLLCFANLPHVCSGTSLPSVTGEIEIVARELGHPLISGEARVNNDVALKDSIFVISGSNMSGKTTFMRTVGINLVLARAGSYVCAGEMVFPQVEIMTSMRLADDLNEGISTFYAELKRVKGIVELAKKGPRMVFLIDEIFRGTNSVDRLSGARAVLGKLDSLGVMGIITTHDLELCEVEALHKRVRNFSFSEEYREGRILFDYKIRPGRSTTTNARYLMEMVGIG